MTRSHTIRRLLGLVALAGALFIVSPAVAQLGVPDVMPYQGQLMRADGTTYSGVVNITVRMYEQRDQAAPIWTEDLANVDVEDGQFYVYLGMTNPIVPNVNDGRTRYLGISINGEPEATPRQAVGSVPFAIYARNAAYLGGQPADVFVTLAELDARNYVDEQRVNEIVNNAVINNGGGLNAEQVNQLIDDRNYVDGDTVNELIDDRNYVSEDRVNELIDDRNYVSEERVLELIAENAINNGDGLDANAVNALIDARQYLNEDAIRALIASYNYLDEAAVNALIDARGYLNEAAINALIDARNYLNADGVNALIDARNYLNADGVNALIDARNYLDEDAIIALIDARIAANQAAVDARVDELEGEVDDLRDQLAALQDVVNNLNNNNNNNNGFGLRGYILGQSAAQTNGRITFNNRNGTAGADEMCRATFANEPTAHLCTIAEIERSLAAGTYNAANAGNINNTTTWTMGHLIQGAAFGNGTTDNTCENLMYNSADEARGQRVSIFLNANSPGNGGGLTGHIFNVQRDIGCNTNMQVMCCR